MKRHRQHDAPPRLYDLTNLQKDMSKLHGLTAAHTLTALQSLYEQRLTTYPRTATRDSSRTTTWTPYANSPTGTGWPPGSLIPPSVPLSPDWS